MRKSFVFLLALLFCLSGCETGSTDAASSSETPPAAQSGTHSPAQIEIRVGMTMSQVLQLLGAADKIQADPRAGEIWSYNGKRANFAYAANKEGGEVLIIDGYSAQSGVPLFMTIKFDKGRKVTDFTYQQAF